MKMKRCVKCNAEIEDDAKFCTNCGSVVESTAEKEKTANDSASAIAEQQIQQDLAAGAEGAQVLNNQQNTEKKKRRFSPKVAIISAAGLIVVCILVIVIYKVIGSGKVEGILYLKGEDLKYGTGKEEDTYKVTDNYDGSTIFSRELYSGWDAQDRVKYSEDHRFVYFPIEEDGSSYTYCWRDLDRVDKDDEVEVDEDISSSRAHLSKDGSKFFYTKDYEDKLYVYDRETEEKEKLDEYVSEFYVNKEGNYLIYRTDDLDDIKICELSLKGLSGDSETIVKDASIVSVDAEKKQVYYMKDGDLYFKEHGTEEKKLASDVASVKSITDENLFYFIREKEVNHKLSEFISDDLQESDSKLLDVAYIEEPVEPEVVDENDYKTQKIWVQDYLGSIWNEEKQEWGNWDYEIDTDAYNKAREDYEKDYEEWKEECNRVEEENNRAYDEYQAKLERDELREWLSSEEYEVIYTEYSLYYWDGSKEHKIADNIEESCLAADEFPCIKYNKYKTDVEPQVTMSEFYDNYLYDGYYAIDDLSMDVEDSRALDEKTYLAYKEVEKELKNEGTIQFTYAKDNKIVFIDSEDYSLKSADVTNLSDDSIVTIDKDVRYFYMGSDNKTIYYMKDLEDGMGDLYKDEEKIASEVATRMLYSFPKSDSLLYMKDYDHESGTLYLYKDNKEIKISKDVAFYCPYDENNIAIIKDYDVNDENGDLELYKKGKLIPIDRKVSTIIWTEDMGEYGYYYY